MRGSLVRNCTTLETGICVSATQFGRLRVLQNTGAIQTWERFGTDVLEHVPGLGALVDDPQDHARCSNCGELVEPVTKNHEGILDLKSFLPLDERGVCASCCWDEV